MVSGNLARRLYLLSKAEFIAWYMRYPKNGKCRCGTIMSINVYIYMDVYVGLSVLWVAGGIMSLDSCGAPHSKMTLCQIRPGLRLDKYQRVSSSSSSSSCRAVGTDKSWWQHPTRHLLYGHQPPITKTIQVRRTRHAGHCWRSRDELISDVLLWTPTCGRAKAGRPASKSMII